MKICFTFICFLSLFISGCYFETTLKRDKPSKIFTLCKEDEVVAGNCIASAGTIVDSSTGADITSWINPSSGPGIEASLPDGYYSGNVCSFSDPDLISQNILSGQSLFAVTGSAIARHPSCSDNALNTVQCSTASSRYVYAQSFGGRSLNCSNGLNGNACWTNASNTYVTSVAGSNFAVTGGAISGAIPLGYYDGTQAASLSDADIVPGNIRYGVELFGVVGTFSLAYPYIQASMQFRDKTTTQNKSRDETMTGGAAYTNSSTGYRAVPIISKDDDGGTSGSTNITPVDRTGWSATTCGTTQTSIEARIAHCVSVFGVNATWDGPSKGNSGQGRWKLVSRSGGTITGGEFPITSVRGREVWRDERTMLLWSSRLANPFINWCRATGSNNITNNPAAEDDPSDMCDSGDHQNFGTGPGVKAISACFEDGDNYFTSTYSTLSNDGKVGLGLSSTPSVAWRVPTVSDYRLAEVHGIRFVMPDMRTFEPLPMGEWTATVNSNGRDNAIGFDTDYGGVNFMNNRATSKNVRCVGR